MNGKRLIKYCFLLAGLLVCGAFHSLPLYCQSGPIEIPSDDDPSIRLSQQNGLSDLYIKKMLQDTQGFIWVAGHTGLNRFDGSDVSSLC